VKVGEPQIIALNLRQTGPTLAEWLKAREELHKVLTGGEKIILRDIFVFTDEELASTTIMPSLRPAGATNQTAVEWKRRMGVTVFVEGEDKGGVMRYKHSKGLFVPELYLLNRSVRPDEDTIGNKNAKSPDGLIQVPNKLLIGLFGWCDADSLHFAVTGKHLDPDTVCWFPHDRFPGGKVARGYWFGRKVNLYWYYADFCLLCCGARSAKKVPLKT